jgi:hypothetical protein
MTWKESAVSNCKKKAIAVEPSEASSYSPCEKKKGCAMAQAVSCRPLTAKARIHAYVSPCGICGRQAETGFSPSSSRPIHGRGSETYSHPSDININNQV